MFRSLELGWTFRALAVLVVAAFLAAPLRAAQPSVGEVTPVDGDAFPARLTGIDADWTFHFETDTAMPRIPAADLASWGAEVDREAGPITLLADGGRIVNPIKSLSGDRLTLVASSNDDPYLIWIDPVVLPVERVRGILFQPPAEAIERDKLEQAIAGATGEQDVVLLKNGDRVEGFLRMPPPPAGPVAPGGTAPKRLEAITLEVKGAEASIPLDSVTALIFNPALVAPPRVSGIQVEIGLKDGSLLKAVAFKPGGFATITLPGGAKLTTDAATLWDEIVFLRPDTPRVVYLSDLRPIGYKHIPFLDLDWPYHTDRNVLGGKLRAAGNVYSKGLGMHSASRLAYDLRDEFERFQTALAIDAAAGRRGSATVRIFLDRGDGSWMTGYASPVLRGGEAPLPISVDVRGAQRIAILVEFADRGDLGDHVDLLDARVVR